MPQIFKIGAYIVYFWSNENTPLEPIHIHVNKGTPSPYKSNIQLKLYKNIFPFQL